MINLITSQTVRRDFASRTSSDLKARLKSKLKRPNITLTVGRGHACGDSSCTTSSCNMNKRKRSDADSSSSSSSPSSERSIPDVDISDAEEEDSEEFSEETSSQSEGGVSEDVDYKGSDRARLFQDYLDNIDASLARFRILDQNKPKCSTCEQSTECDLFCKNCCDFFCQECHDAGKGSAARHCTEKWNPNMQNHNIFFPSFEDTFEVESRKCTINAFKTLCICEEMDTENRVPCNLIFLGEDFRLWEVQLLYCSSCSCPISSCLRYGFLFIPTKGHTVPNMASSLEVCEFITSFQDLSLGDLKESISTRNWGLLYSDSSNVVNIKLADLGLTKYAYAQLLKRLEEWEIELCPCCFCPRRNRLCPDVLIEDYTNLHRSKRGSNAKLKKLLTTYVKDEEFFADYGEIFKVACKAGGSSSLPHDAPVNQPKKKTCVDKFKITDPPSKFLDIRKLLVMTCEHQYIKIAAISRKRAEHAQYCMSVAAKVQEILDILCNDFSFDAACKLLPVALAALPHVPKPLHDRFLKLFCSNLKYGPFHSVNHTVDCQLKMDVTILGDTIESVFKVLKCNKASLRPMILAFWVCEVEYRICRYQNKKLENLGITYVKFVHQKNPDQMAKLQNRISTVAQKVYPDESTEDIYSFESFAEKVINDLGDADLNEERIESLSLRYIGLRLKLKYLEVALAKRQKKKGSESVLPSLMPPQIWKYTCGPAPKDIEKFSMLTKKLEAELMEVIKRLKKLPLNKDGDYFRIPPQIDDQPSFGDQQINYLITTWLIQRLLDLHGVLFTEEREEKIFQKEMPNHKELGDSHMRSQWKLAQMRRKNMVKFKAIYQSLYLHLQTDARRKTADMRYLCSLKEILNQARNLDVIWSSEFTAHTSLKIILLQDSKKLLERIRLQSEGKLWVQRWCCNICLRLLNAMLEIKGFGEGKNAIGNRLKIKKYLKAAKIFLASKIVATHERQIQQTFRSYISSIMRGSPEEIDPENIIDAFGIPVYDEVSKETVFPNPGNPSQGKPNESKKPQKRLKTFDMGSSQIQRITYTSESAEAKEFLRQQKALYARLQSLSSRNNDQQAPASSDPFSNSDDISIPAEPPTSIDQFEQLCANLMASKPRNVQILHERRSDLKRVLDQYTEQDERWEQVRDAYITSNKAYSESLTDWQNQVRQFGIERHPSFNENPPSADKINNLMDLGIWGEEISILHNPSAYGSDTQCKGLENILREHDFGNDVKILTSRHYIGASFSPDEILQDGEVEAVAAPAGCIMRQYGQHYTAVAMRVDNRLEYGDSLRPGQQPTNGEMLQASVLFDVKKENDAMLFFSWNTQKQEAPNCLYFAFLNLFLLLSGYDLAEIKVQESFLRIWVMECFKNKEVKCPFMFGVVELVEDDSSEEVDSQESADNDGTFFAAVEENSI